MSETPSYIDYETFLSPSFSPQSFANSLILSTNNATDTTLDLSTPLSRVLFDIQEIDTHIHNLTTKSALSILEYMKGRDEASKRILDRVEGDVGRLRASYDRLEREVLARYDEAEKARLASLRSLEVLRIGRAVGRAVGLGRQLEIQLSDSGLGVPGRAGKEDHRALVRAVYTILEFRALLERGDEGRELERVNVVKTFKSDLFGIVEERIKSKAQQVIREFSISNLSSSSANSGIQPAGESSSSITTFAQTEDAKSRITSAITILYLLSPAPRPAAPQSAAQSTIAGTFQPSLLLTSLQAYLQTALTSSLASISRALATLPTLERTLLEVSARCQNVVALEQLLAGIPTPKHPLLTPDSTQPSPGNAKDGDPSRAEEDEAEDGLEAEQANLLRAILHHLDTPSLPSYFWRSLASNLSPRVKEILGRGGVSARTLRSNRERVGGAVRECVLRGCEFPGASAAGIEMGRRGKKGEVGKVVQAVSWEREAAVMVGSVVGALGR